MLYPLLPYFLAVSLSNNTNDTWKHEPEYKFSGYSRMVTALERDEGTFMGNKLIFDLRCQPSVPDTLICRFESTQIARTRPRAFDATANEDTTEAFRTFGSMNRVFEIKFNDRGIESYVIEKTEPPLLAGRLDMARLIVNQLSIGASISDKLTPKFRNPENFTIGQCDVDFTVTKKASGQDDKTNLSNGGLNFELVALKNLSKNLDESIEIEKKRDLHNCSDRTDYFFGTRYTLGIVLRTVTTKIKSSTSRIFISKKELRAETVNEGEIFGEDGKSQGSVLDHMMIQLVSIEPASEPIQPLKNRVNMEVIANRPGSPYLE